MQAFRVFAYTGVLEECCSISTMRQLRVENSVMMDRVIRCSLLG